MRFYVPIITLGTVALSIILSTVCAYASGPSVTATHETVAVSKFAIVVLDSPRWDFRWTAQWSDTETGLADCLSSELADRKNQYGLLLATTFKRAACQDLASGGPVLFNGRES